MQAVIGLFIILFVALVIYAFYAAAQRRKALGAWARRRGLRFDSSKDDGMADGFPEFGCLHEGSDRYAYNVSRGEWNGRPMTAFDYHYETGSGDDKSSHHFSAVILGSPIPLKPLHIRREHFFDKITEFFGFDDIDFESAEFSRRFHVKSTDKRWAYDVIHQGMMEHLMSAPEFSIQFGVMYVIAWRSATFKPKDFEAAAELIRGMFARLPSYLVSQQTGESA